MADRTSAEVGLTSDSSSRNLRQRRTSQQLMRNVPKLSRDDADSE